jgi:hypothetical protein
LQQMRKTWSITTTTRNPYRLRSQLELLNRECVSHTWDLNAQVKFQVLLIQNRLYGYGEDTGFSTQFLNGLSAEHKEIFTDFGHPLSYDEALAIFNSKKYQDPPMRGRQSFNPLKKLGFVFLEADNTLRLTQLGEYFLSDDFDLPEIFFKSFLKWQIPNPDSRDYSLEAGYNIKPFVGVLHLINQVNSKWQALGNARNGISKNEFILFAPTLVNFNDIEAYANKIIALRTSQQGRSKAEQAELYNNYAWQFATEFLGISDTSKVNKLLSNLRDYGDNAIRYFRFTNLLFIRGGGWYIDLEPRRSTEINMLLDYDNGNSTDFASLSEYQQFLSDIHQPVLPWEDQNRYPEIVQELVNDISGKEQSLGLSSNIPANQFGTTTDGYKKYLRALRAYRRKLQELDVHRAAQNVSNLEQCIESLEDIYNADDRPILLEKLAAIGLHALNDAVNIKPNYPVGDDNEPTFTAPANVPDIECFYTSAYSICEVTMLTSRDQYYNEGQPVMRHLRDFEAANSDKPSYGVFIAPSIHRDTINTYWYAVKYDYEGQKQNIVPLTITDYVNILKTLVQVKTNGGQFKHPDLINLYKEIVDKTTHVSSSTEWAEAIPSIISSWSAQLTTRP